jgi:hypothetical protein
VAAPARDSKLAVPALRQARAPRPAMQPNSQFPVVSWSGRGTPPWQLPTARRPGRWMTSRWQR